MKIRTPHYYKDFKCIAGDCTDTCCAGWEVDVDEESYRYYKKVKGSFGKRLKSVMVPSEDGGCSFTLKKGRCPFLNDANLCDLYTELGEDKLCDTCAEFPRFINEYGSVREIGIAPSCKTAGELIFGSSEKLTFDLEENDEWITSYNDIDPELYFQLERARKTAYAIVQDRSRPMDDRCMLLLEFAWRIQKKIDQERYDLIAYQTKAFASQENCSSILHNLKTKYNNAETAYQTITQYFQSFPGMEVINPDWLKYCDIHQKFMKNCEQGNGLNDYRDYYQRFARFYEERQFEYEQLLMYYVYRYFLDAVNDENLVLKAKNALVGYLVLRQADVAAWWSNAEKLDKEEQIDIAHLYSRQFEHSYTNFEKYSEFFMVKRCYSYKKLMEILNR